MKYKNLFIYYGPMFSGKTTKLINLFTKSQGNKIAFKPLKDTRYKGFIKSRNGKEISAIEITSINEINNYLDESKKYNIFLDETFMIKGNLNKEIENLLIKNHNIYISTLDRDYTGKWFNNIYELLFLAYQKNKFQLYAKCHICGENAKWSVRIINDEIILNNSPKILIDDGKSNSHYEVRCDKHRNSVIYQNDLENKNIIKNNKKNYNYLDE